MLKSKREFDRFPEEKKCFICGTNENKQCRLIAVQGTENGNIIEAEPIHSDCIDNMEWIVNRQVGIIYAVGHEFK